MNLQEFAALKVGDKVANDMSHSHGEVVEVLDGGVRVAWHGADKPVSPGNLVTWFYGVNSTTWMHWTKS